MAKAKTPGLYVDIDVPYSKLPDNYLDSDLLVHLFEGGKPETQTKNQDLELLRSYVLNKGKPISFFPGKRRRGRKYEEFVQDYGDTSYIVLDKEADKLNEARESLNKAFGKRTSIISYDASVISFDALNNCYCKAQIDYRDTSEENSYGFYTNDSKVTSVYLRAAHLRDALVFSLFGGDFEAFGKAGGSVFAICQEPKSPYAVRRIGFPDTDAALQFGLIRDTYITWLQNNGFIKRKRLVL